MSRIVDALVKAATDATFRSVEVRRVSAEPSGPVLVLANHGGGLGDISDPQSQDSVIDDAVEWAARVGLG